MLVLERTVRTWPPQFVSCRIKKDRNDLLEALHAHAIAEAVLSGPYTRVAYTNRCCSFGALSNSEVTGMVMRLPFLTSYLQHETQATIINGLIEAER